MWDGQGKIKIYYGMSKVRKQLSGKRSIYGTIKAAGNFKSRIWMFWCGQSSYQSLHHWLILIMIMTKLHQGFFLSILNNPGKIIMGHWNINSIRNKSDLLKEMVTEEIYVFVISETKLDDSFPVSRFLIKINHTSAWVFCCKFAAYFRNFFSQEHLWMAASTYNIDTIKKIRNTQFSRSIFIEIRIKSNKWLLYCSYYSSKLQVSSYLQELSNGFDTYPFKKKYFREILSKFVCKELSKAIILRTKLRNQLLKVKTHESIMKYKKQRNIYVKKFKRSNYENVDLKKITDNKKFWSTVKTLFNITDSTECINIGKNGKIIGNDKEIARIFHEFFVKIVSNLGINANHDFLINVECLHDLIDKTISKYNNHPSILTMKKFTRNSDSSLTFQHVSKGKVTRIINTLEFKGVTN